MTAEDVLSFWLEAPATDMPTAQRKMMRWFAGGPEVDAQIRERLPDVLVKAEAGELDAWPQTPEGRLALIIVLDQFSRNLYRGTPRVYSNDHRAISLTLEGLAMGLVRSYPREHRMFFLMPLGHSENLHHQLLRMSYLEELALEAPEVLQPMMKHTLDNARKYLETITRFGRFPTRNPVLGRYTTDAERAFLAYRELDAKLGGAPGGRR